MKELSKRLSEVEYVLKQMDMSYIEKLPDNIVEFISDNKDYEYSEELCNKKSLNMKKLHVDTVTILTYLNMNFFLEPKEKEELDLLIKQTQQEIEKRKEEQYKYDDLFPKNTNIDKLNENKQLEEYRKQNWFSKLFAKLFRKTNHK